jgi:HD-like signal output (HDOD) protein
MKINEYASKAETLFVLPDSVIQLKACMDDQIASMDDVGAILLTDSGLTAHILRIANSALYRFPRKIDTVTKAIQVIGTRATYDLSLAYGVSFAFKDASNDVIDIDKYWEQSICCGLLAKHIADFNNHREPERFFVSGLLNNIGELVVSTMTPDLARKCLHISKDLTPPNLQLAVLGFDYASLSAELMKNWGLPTSIWQPLTSIHTLDDRSLSDDASVLRLAYYLTLDNVNNDIYTAFDNTTDNMYQGLNMESDDLEDALDTTNLKCISMMSLFSPSSFMPY